MLKFGFRTVCCLASFSILPQTVLAAQPEEIVVEGYPYNSRLLQDNLTDHMEKNGVNFYQSGGIAALPVLNGLNDDRIRVTVDGASVTAACANHMNPVLSYVDFEAITNIDVIAGITPVSLGGDSIAGTISLQTDQSRFTESSGVIEKDGKLAYDFNSNSNSQRVSLQAAYSQKNFSLQYNGFTEQADSYEDGHGDKVLDTLYRAENHTVTAAFRDDKQELSIKLSHQAVPYQGFPNQYMDMVANDSNGINLNHHRDFAWGHLHTQAAWQKVDHEMGFFTEEKTGTMPMITKGVDINYSLKAELPLAENHTLTLGHEFYRFTLEDYWPAVPGNMMMGPNDFININDGERDRLAFYAESDYQINNRWGLLGGIRVEQVDTDAGDIQAYNSMPLTMMGMPNLDAAAATQFNSRSREQSDTNVDLSIMASYSQSDSFGVEFGYARKSRSPNLYERYSWGRGTMAMTMLGWFGDANGYVGDIDLKPEVAHTLGAKFSWADPDKGRWHLEVSPYYTKVDQFVDANVIGSFHPRRAMQVTRPLLQFTNLDATLFGTRIDAHAHLGSTGSWGMWNLNASLDYQRGERDEDNSNLYQIMPLQMSVALEQRNDNWLQRLSVDWVNDKSRVDPRRMEPQTDSYALVNWQAQYQWSAVSMSVQVSNLLDEYYELPLGGVNYAGWKAEGMQGQFDALAGQGRSFNVGLQYSF